MLLSQSSIFGDTFVLLRYLYDSPEFSYCTTKLLQAGKSSCQYYEQLDSKTLGPVSAVAFDVARTCAPEESFGRCCPSAHCSEFFYLF